MFRDKGCRTVFLFTQLRILMNVAAPRCRISCSRSGTPDCAFSVAEHNGVARSASAKTKPVRRDMWGSLACSNIERAAAYHERRTSGARFGMKGAAD
jgi:hypothetical protein